MVKNYLLKKGGVVGIIIIFIYASFVSSIGGYSEDVGQVDIDFEDVCEFKEDVLVTCSTFGFPGEPSQETSMSQSDAEFLYDKIKELQIEIARDPLSDKTLQLQHEIITLADEHNLLPAGLSVKTLKSRLTPTLRPQNPKLKLPPLQNTSSEMFCNYISTGSGSALPIIILPRLLPILLSPIPRLFVRWSTLEGVTSCGGLRSGTGFIASGAQNGIALGFWGIGFSIFLPPVSAYGLFGYALYASVNAEEIELWPPNNPPVISNENPSSGTWNVPVSLSELSFQIEDADGDPMSYSVTTSPDIGSGSGTNKGDGIYTVSVSGLKSNTQYQWVVEVDDGEDVTMQEFSFMTEELPFDPFDEGWQYRKKITIDHTQVAGDLSYFPVLVSTVDSDLQDKTQEDGDDILFMDGTGVAHKLYHEIEYYDDSSGEMLAWVNIPSVSSDKDTVLYMYYGNSGCSNQQAPEKVWESNYKAVYHMNEAEDGLIDGTINDNDCNSISGSPDYQQIGKVGYAIDFEESSNVAFEGGDILDSLSEISVEAWIKIEEVASSHSLTIASHEDAWYFNARGLYSGNYSRKIQWAIHGDGGSMFSADDCYIGSWEYVVGTFIDDTDELKLYRNGILTDEASWDGHMPNDSDPFAVGNQNGNGHYFDGLLDEIRISTIARSAEWISTSYLNLNNPSNFLSFGPEEIGP